MILNSARWQLYLRANNSFEQFVAKPGNLLPNLKYQCVPDRNMSSKKEKLAKIFSQLRLNQVLNFMRGYLVNDLRIIAYHRICEVDDINDPELVSATVEEFDWQVSYIKKYYSPLTFEQVIKRLDNNEKLPGNSIIITFDDGFFDNFRNAYPVLKKYRVPATFFISTAYIGSDETFWFNLVSRIIMLNVGKSFEFKSTSYQVPEDIEQRLSLISVILEVCKSVPNFERLELLESMREQLINIDGNDPLSRPMSWDNVREMSANGMEFGSHSQTHPILSQLTADELKAEIHDSKQAIEEQIDKKIHTISYPEGMDYAFNLDVLDKVEKAGYLFGTTYISGNNFAPKLKDFQLKRGHVERYVGRDLFASMLALPEVFF